MDTQQRKASEMPACSYLNFYFGRPCRSGQSETGMALRSYASAFRMNQAIITGEHPCNINNYGPVRAEREEVIPGLLKLHDYGVYRTPHDHFTMMCASSYDQQGGWWEKWR